MEFKGRQYHQLVSAGYALVPGKNMIVFITNQGGKRKILHAVPTGKGEAIEVDLGDTSFGGQIGGRKEDPDTDYIESVDGDKITFAMKILFGPKTGMIVRSIVDLKARTFAEKAAEGQGASR